jgi:hypothetical protein
MPGDLSSEQEFPNWLRELGKGSFNDEHDNVVLPQFLRSPSDDIDDLIKHVYPTIQNAQSDAYFKERCILAPRDREVHEINRIALKRFPGSQSDILSVDRALDPQTQLPSAPIDFLHGTTVSGFSFSPAARLSLKVGCPVILLYHMHPGEGMSEGSRGIVTKISTRILELRMFSGDIVLVPKIPVNSTDGIQRLQFPVALAFAMTIEKAQGQTFSAVGIDLRYPCFRHGQLYLALSRANRAAGIKCIVGTANTKGETKNIVYREVVSGVSHT